MKKLLLVGYGNMGSAIYNVIKDFYNVIIVDPNKGYEEVESLEDFDIILLAIKPQILDIYLKSLKNKLNIEKTKIVTIIAGIPVNFYKSKLGENAQIIRVMPNLALQIKKGTSAILNDIQNTAFDIFSKTGVVINVDKEEDLHLVTAASGSSPAFVFLFIKSLIESVVKLGLDQKKAKELVLNTVIGSAEFVKRTNNNIDELIDMVCSKKGTTIEGIESLENLEFCKIIEKSVEKVVNRSVELSRL